MAGDYFWSMTFGESGVRAWPVRDTGGGIRLWVEETDFPTSHNREKTRSTTFIYTQVCTSPEMLQSLADEVQGYYIRRGFAYA